MMASVQSPLAPTLREQAAMRASAGAPNDGGHGDPLPNAFASPTPAVAGGPSPRFAEETPRHESFPFPNTPHTPEASHPLAYAFSSETTNDDQEVVSPESLAQSARKEWQHHGGGLTQALEEKRRAQERLPGALTVRVLSADTRRDVAGAKYTAYILRVQQGGSTGVLELEHRYSEFAKLHELLQNHSIRLPCIFPEKHWAGRLGSWTPSLKWAPNQHQDLVQYRKVQLDVWLVHLVEKYNLGELPHRVHQAVLDFLSHSDRPPCDQENYYYSSTATPVQPAAAAPASQDDNFPSPAPQASVAAAWLGYPESPYPTNAPSTSTAEQWTKWSNPLSFTLGSTIRQAAATAEHMFFGNHPHSDASIWKESDQSIPLDLLHHAKGLCFLTVLKAGLVVSGRVGTGLLVARMGNADGDPARPQWSAPCALGTVGMGWGMLAGGDITHYLVVLTTTEAVDALLSGTVQLGAELGVAVGPVGRGATSQVASSRDGWSVHPAYSYAHSQGLFVGMSLEGSILKIRGDVNAKFYGNHYSPAHILDCLPPPKAGAPLYQALSRALQLKLSEDAFRPSQLFQSSGGSSTSLSAHQVAQNQAYRKQQEEQQERRRQQQQAIPEAEEASPPQY